MSLSIRQLSGAEPVASVDLSNGGRHGSRDKTLGDASGLVIASLLEGNSSLTSLDLGGNELGVAT
eukprot:3382228-Prymnesium_polylepis.1